MSKAYEIARQKAAGSQATVPPYRREPNRETVVEVRARKAAQPRGRTRQKPAGLSDSAKH